MRKNAQSCPLTGQVFAIFGRWGRRVPKLLSRNSEEVRRKRLEKDKLFNPRGLVTCDRRRLLRAPPASSAFPLPYWPVKSPILHRRNSPNPSSKSLKINNVGFDCSRRGRPFPRPAAGYICKLNDSPRYTRFTSGSRASASGLPARKIRPLSMM